MHPTLTGARRLLMIAAFALPGTGLGQNTDYELGLGYEFTDWMTVGGYFSTEYEKSEDDHKLVVDDLALLVYGEFASRFSYLLELESIDVYTADFENDDRDTNFPPTIERLYIDYKLSDNLSVRAGKQITPIGYWNLQPINVLRETTSNPRYSRQMFPKFLTGLDFYGYAPFADDLVYHVYLQNGRDMDEANINLTTDRHTGISLEKTLSAGWKLGGAIGRFKETSGITSRYLQLNSRFDSNAFSLIAEGILNQESIPGAADDEARAFYLQGEYRYRPRHAVITRLEYYHDSQGAAVERIGVLGYSYRPRFPVSMKIEYQWHSDSRLDQVLSSFSVLF